MPLFRGPTGPRTTIACAPVLHIHPIFRSRAGNFSFTGLAPQFQFFVRGVIAENTENPTLLTDNLTFGVLWWGKGRQQ